MDLMRELHEGTGVLCIHNEQAQGDCFLQNRVFSGTAGTGRILALDPSLALLRTLKEAKERSPSHGTTMVWSQEDGFVFSLEK